jgi:hypothetical protein
MRRSDSVRRARDDCYDISRSETQPSDSYDAAVKRIDFNESFHALRDCNDQRARCESDPCARSLRSVLPYLFYPRGRTVVDFWRVSLYAAALQPITEQVAYVMFVNSDEMLELSA